MLEAHGDATPDIEAEGFSRSRGFLAASIAIWALLSTAGADWLPPLRHAWAYNLWQYLPPWWSAASAAAALAICFPAVRSRIIDAARIASRAACAVPTWIRLPLIFVALTTLFWVLRERQIFGDSHLLISATGTGSAAPGCAAGAQVAVPVLAGIPCERCGSWPQMRPL